MPRPYKGGPAARRATLEGRTQELYNNARQRAKKRNIEFTLTRAWIAGALSAGRCAATGLPFEWASRSPYAPSLDQIDPGHGYTPDNTRLVSAIYNYAKNVWTHDDVTRLAKAIVAANDN